jgi:uncharacterized protein (DUF1800 family)
MSPTDQLVMGKLIRAQASERQLLEVVTDFWENHFSIYSAKMPWPDAPIIWEREVIRPRALGKFRDLLGAVARSPMMLFYLDNHLSVKGNVNENYARELLELHTLGVDGGYTQQDVINVARALTGWGIAPPVPPPARPTAAGGLVRQNVLVSGPLGGARPFRFIDSLHDRDEKVVLGRRLAAGRGIEDGEDVLDIVARHPSTARYIALKLARRFVSDDPPPALIARAAATFTRTDGDIAAVLRTIVTSDEFFAREALRAKMKTPYEFMVSARRALGMPPDTTNQSLLKLREFGQPVFGRQTPDGWPDRAESWINPGALFKRVQYSADAAMGRAAQFPIETWTGWSEYASAVPSDQANAIVRAILGGVASADTRAILLATTGTASAVAPDSARTRLRDMLVVALGSPEFQRR